MGRNTDKVLRRQHLPGMLGQVESIVGYPRAVKFAQAFGGTELYIPKSCCRDHPIARAVGHAGALQICARLHGQGTTSCLAFQVPTGEIELKWNIARKLRLEGYSVHEIVMILRKKHHITAAAYTIRRLVSDLAKPVHRPRKPADRPAPLIQPTFWDWLAGQNDRQ